MSTPTGWIQVSGDEFEIDSMSGPVTVSLPPAKPGVTVKIRNCGPSEVHVGSPPWPLVLQPGEEKEYRA